MIDWSAAIGILIGGGAVLALQALGRAIISDVATRISTTLWGIRIFDCLTPRFFRHPVWSGTWEVILEVESENFKPVNSEKTQLYRCLNSIALEGSGTTTSGSKFFYGFIGKLSRDKTILTGTWFDRLSGATGYHGVYQLRLQTPTKSAVGLWAGFSNTSDAVKSGKLTWTRIEDPKA